MNSADTSTTTIRNSIDQGGLSFAQFMIIAVCFLLSVADGFDVVAMSMVAPVISEQWQIDPKTLGVIFSAALLGMTVGAMFLSSLSDRFGRRKIILLSVAIIAIAMICTAYVSSVTQLMITRFFTGLGVGGILASAITMTSEYSSSRHRNLTVILVQSGYSVGAVVVGPIAAYFIAQHSWQDLFLYAGVFSVVLWFLAYLYVPESLEFIAGQTEDESVRLNKINTILQRLKRPTVAALPSAAEPSKAITKGSVAALLSKGMRWHTLRLWVVFFFAFWGSYLMVNWTPKLFVNSGLDISQGIYALTLFTAGGLAGALGLGFLSTRVRLTYAIAAMFFLAVALLLAFSLCKPTSLVQLNILVTLIGFAHTGGFTSLYAVAANSYPTEVRATGLGWCVGLGRSGAIISPIAAGYFVAGGWDMYGLFLVLVVPATVIPALMIAGVRIDQRSVR